MKLILTLEEVKSIVFELGNKLGLNNDSILYPMFSSSSQVFSEGTSIFIADFKYHYIIMDRGQVRKQLDSEELNIILYEVFKNITASLARKFELEQRDQTSDSRRIWWKKQLQLLDEINSEFSVIRKNEMDRLLVISPFKDN